jgi:hypothetical protein
MGRKTLVAFIPVLVLAACSSPPQKQAAFASVRTIELRDGTDPVILGRSCSTLITPSFLHSIAITRGRTRYDSCYENVPAEP